MTADELAEWFRAPPTLRSARLELRPIQVVDAPELFEWSRDRRMCEYVPHKPFEDLDSVRVYLARRVSSRRAGEPSPFAIRELSGGPVIGTVGLGLVDAKTGVAEIGYQIGPPWWGNGYAGEAMRRLIVESFETLRLSRVEAICSIQNAASVRVLEKSAMTREGVLRSRLPTLSGDRHDCYMYSILRHECS